MDRIKQFLNRHRFLVKAGAAAVVLSLIALLMTGIHYIQVQSQLLQVQHDEMVQEQIALEAAKKNQQIASRASELAGWLRLQEYDRLASFFENPDELFEKSCYFIQQDCLVEESALRQKNGDAILLDLENRSLYVGKVDDQGLRSGYGLQFGYSPNYVSTNENYEKITYPAAHVYRGSFVNNLADGQGEYLQIHSVLHESQKTIAAEGTFRNSQMDGSITVTWKESGREYSDTIYVEQGTLAVKPSMTEGYVYARAWDFLRPVTLKVFDESELENTFIWHDYLNHYLQPEQLLALHSGNYAVL